ncbi:hypothetical protein H0A36_24145 [Endozoicomonas sp. SM1973]|uniref:Uncharacterized protein n=1 Tax=Spartinivicinus marinus TaxID=2994442 RepID=A0A853IMT7_9GAMM|nr:hypothetical protein [Spartinivicinus marinus]NYZ69116.1 hypothetical protein [Spartinivicinus marinus]
MLKFLLDSLDDVDENLHALYEEADGKYQLKVDGIEDTGALKRAKDHEKTARKAAEDQARELKEQLEALQVQINESKDADARKNGDIEALEKSWQDKFTNSENSWSEKLTSRENELNSTIENLQNNLKSILVDKEAVRLASELAVEGSSELLIPHLKARLATSERDGQLVTVVNDSEGKPSALTLDELKQEFANNKAFAPVVVGSHAFGGSADRGNSSGATHNGDVTKMSRQEKLAYFENQINGDS